MRTAALFVVLLALTACGKTDNDPGPGGVTVGEARALDEAAEMIEARRMPPEALHSGAPSAPAPTPAGQTGAGQTGAAPGR